MNNLNDLMKLSQDLLSEVKLNKPYQYHLEKLSSVELSSLEGRLTDAFLKSFWINIYNAFSIVSLKSDPTVLKQPLSRILHFKKRIINVGGQKLSLDDIDHGLLRKSKLFIGKGYFNKIFTSQFEINYRVQNFDPRIHFALNCGALSCPPIKFYDMDKLDEQLELATESFLNQESKYNPSTNTVNISKIFDWYVGDFGGQKGVVEFLKKYQIVPIAAYPKIVFNAYNWTA